MKVARITESVLSISEEVIICARCGGAARVRGGSCVSCLLLSALGDVEEGEEEDFEAVLATAPVPDSEWRIGNYAIREEIGRGGMGVIYRAQQRHSRRIVALKRVLSYHGDSRETLVRFRREAEAAASLDHPNILPIYEVSESDGLPFFTMKLALGGSLQQAAASLRAEPRKCVQLVAKVACAIAHAHTEGILHRDLKPGNILLDGRGEPLVTDFGLAKWIDTTSDLTRSLAIYGTPGFIAPEQAEGSATALTPAADVYSLGAVLFDLLTGRPPFLGEHAIAVMRQAADKAAPKLRSLAPQLDRDLETMCARCLEREPALRYASAADFAADLERWLQGRPIVARPVLPPLQLWRWARRNPVLSTSAVVIVLLAVTATSGMLSTNRLQTAMQSRAMAARSVALIPFEDLDAASFDSPLAQAVTSSTVRAFGTSPFPFRGVSADQLEAPDLYTPEQWRVAGAKLGVAHLLIGTVRSTSGGLQAGARLIEAASGKVLRHWAYTAPTADELAALISPPASELLETADKQKSATATTEHPPDWPLMGHTTNPVARDYVATARELRARLNVPDFDEAIRLLELAVATDPSYGAAYAMLASACQARSELDPAGPWEAKAMAAAEAAARLAPGLPESHRVQAGTYRRRGEVRHALQSLIEAFELEPASDRAAVMVGNAAFDLGQPHLALRWYRKGVRRAMRPGIYAEYIADAWAQLERDDLAEAAFARSLIFRPTLPGASVGLSRLAMWHRNFSEALTLTEQAHKSFPEDPQPLAMKAQVEFFSHNYGAAAADYEQLLMSNRSGGVTLSGAVRFVSALGFIKRLSGDPQADALLAEARQLDHEALRVAPRNFCFLYSLAGTEAAAGNNDQALEFLRQAVAAGWTEWRSTTLDPRFDGIRGTPGFNQSIQRMREAVAKMAATAERDRADGRLAGENL